MNKRQAGQAVEEAVCDYLKQNNVVILERNYRCRSGEIDIIARDADYLVFIEVKYRSTRKYGSALEAVDIKKRAQICKVFTIYRMQKRLPFNVKVRFDVIGVDNETISWIKNAFSYVY